MVLDSWEPITLYFLTCLIIPAGLIGVAFLTSVKQRRPDIDNQKHLAFESGVSRGFIGRQRFPISFYLTAMLFIIFDIEMVFLYPLGVVLGDLGLFGFVELVIFTAILLVAYAYVWGRGALEWE